MRRLGPLTACLIAACSGDGNPSRVQDAAAVDAPVSVDSGQADASSAADSGAPDAGPPADPALTRPCGKCHATEGAAFALPSSHSALLWCTTCHVVQGPPGPDHARLPACDSCHSEALHGPTMDCLTCHDPHGTPNLFLVRAMVATGAGTSAAVRFVAAEGASADGLARAGALGTDPGTGLCEVCHDATLYYTRTGAGAPHYGDWCPACHDHQLGFAAPP